MDNLPEEIFELKLEGHYFPRRSSHTTLEVGEKLNIKKKKLCPIPILPFFLSTVKKIIIIKRCNFMKELFYFLFFLLEFL